MSSSETTFSTIPFGGPGIEGNSTSTPFPTAATSTASSSSTDNSNNNNSLATSSSLYLFTFLATLLLLLSVSCAIVVRSLIIRRRYQRRVAEALAQGIMLPPTPHAQRRRDFGEKPKLWDAHAAPPEDVYGRWKDLMPVSARVVHEKLSGAGQRIVNVPPRPTFMQTASTRLARAQRWRPPFFRSHSHARSTPEPMQTLNAINTQSIGDAAAAIAEQDNSVTDDAKLQVNVLIAMPSPYKPRAWEEADLSKKGKRRSSSQSHADNEEEEVPDLVFGSVELPWKVVIEQPNAASSNPATSSAVSNTGPTSPPAI